MQSAAHIAGQETLRGASAPVTALARGLAAARPRARADQSAATLRLTGWMLGLAVGSLIFAGCLALLLVVGRIPVLSEWVSAPQFFKRCLVVHVDLALLVWFFAFAAGLFSLLPGDRADNWMFRAGLRLAGCGVAGMVAGALVPGAAPVLSNYVPVIDHPLFLGGLVFFFFGLLVCFVNGRLMAAPARKTSTRAPSAGTDEWPALPRLSPEVGAGLKTVALAYLVAVTTFAISWAVTPPLVDARIYYELVFWGGGHVLQVANVAAMLAVWLLLLGSVLRRPVVSARVAWVLFALLLAPHLLAPLLTVDGTTSSLYRTGFTRLMQFGIFPVVTVFLGLCLRQIGRAAHAGVLGRASLRDPRLMGFAASAALTVTGFLLGASIRNSNTMIPAHYHASIGAVTVAFMAVTYVVLEPLGFALPGARWRRLIPWQLAMFGFGQVIFSFGFAWGGAHGLGRKAYGSEQHLRTAGEYAGIAVMGLGGGIAIVGGLLFLLLVVCALWPRLSRSFSKTPTPTPARSTA